MLSCIPILYSSGCQSMNDSDAALHGGVIPGIITFKGKTYESTGDVVAIEPIPDEVSPRGQAFWPTQSESSTESTDIIFEVYSIRGVDTNQAIALKYLLVSTKERAYYYLRYDRKLP